MFLDQSLNVVGDWKIILITYTFHLYSVQLTEYHKPAIGKLFNLLLERNLNILAALEFASLCDQMLSGFREISCTEN